MQTIKIASRKSVLALKQTQIVIDKLQEKYKNINFEIVKVDTLGDKNLEHRLSDIGTKGLFTYEIEQMLINGYCDMAVHSLKDMPTEFENNLELGAYLKRQSNKDIIIFSKDYTKIEDLPKNAKIGTSSIRREMQLKNINPNFNICNIRGNIQTRLQKMIDENFDAIILAKVGMQRLNILNNFSYQELDFVSAVGQGCICVQVCKDNNKIRDMLYYLNDKDTQICVENERKFLHSIGGSCHTPIGAYCYKKDNTYIMTAYILDKNGKNIYKSITADSNVWEQMVQSLKNM
jgi:hydroxymethylbilane synthase